jgi:hypothetical protein
MSQIIAHKKESVELVNLQTNATLEALAMMNQPCTSQDSTQFALSMIK